MERIAHEPEHPNVSNGGRSIYRAATQRRPAKAEDFLLELRYLDEDLPMFVADIWIEVGRELATEQEEREIDAARMAAEEATAVEARRRSRTTPRSPPLPPPPSPPRPSASPPQPTSWGMLAAWRKRTPPGSRTRFFLLSRRPRSRPRRSPPWRPPRRWPPPPPRVASPRHPRRSDPILRARRWRRAPPPGSPRRAWTSPRPEARARARRGQRISRAR